MPTTANISIAFTDLTNGTDGYSERFAQDSLSTTRNVEVAWSDRQAFFNECLGFSYPILFENNGVTRFDRRLPMAHPDLDGFWCTAVDTIQVLAPNAGIADPSFHSFSRIQYALHFQSLPYDLKEDPALYAEGELCRFVERKFNFTGENLTVGHANFKWVTAPVDPIHTPPSKIFPVVELEYVWRKVPAIPFININNCLGKVNSATFDVGTYARKWGVPNGGWAAQTVLFVGARAEMVSNETSVFGETRAPTSFDIYYKFLYRYNGGNGWNYFWRPTAQAFQLITHDGAAGGNRVYETASLSTLFQLS